MFLWTIILPPRAVGRLLIKVRGARFEIHLEIRNFRWLSPLLLKVRGAPPATVVPTAMLPPIASRSTLGHALSLPPASYMKYLAYKRGAGGGCSPPPPVDKSFGKHTKKKSFAAGQFHQRRANIRPPR
jgi:hypothetical protein